jgi:hypothetical protein
MPNPPDFEDFNVTIVVVDLELHRQWPFKHDPRLPIAGFALVVGIRFQ